MVRGMLYRIVLLCAALSLNTVEAQPGPPASPLNTYIVQVTNGVDPAQVGRGVVQRTRGRLGHVYTNAVRGFSVQLPPTLAGPAIEAQPGVLLVEPDIPVYAVAQTLPTGVNRIEADNSGATAPVDVDIAFIDTGIDVDHPDLTVIGGRHFYSLWGLLAFEDDLYDDDNGHGSHCAGIAAAKNNDLGVVGVAPGARLWAVKVLDSTGSGYLSDVIAGVDWVTAHAGTIEVANMSLTATASSSIFRTAIQNSVAAGVVHIVAAGNDAKDVYGFDGVFGTSDDVIPAAYPEAATISAMVDSDGVFGGEGDETGYGEDDSFASFSNKSYSVVSGNPVTSPGAAIDLLMPGVNIYSCDMNGGYAVHSGTSMASPHAAGLAALYIASNGRATNANGVYAIRQALINAGVAQTDSRGLTLQNDYDGNYENIGWAGSAAPPPPPEDNPPSVTITNPVDGATVFGSVIVMADASDDLGVTEVEFFIDDYPIGVGTESEAGWSARWDTTLYSNGSRTVTATATDTTGHTTEDWVSVIVENPVDDPPSVTITNPGEGATVSETVIVIADASDDTIQVEFFVDGGSIGLDTDSSDGWSASWDTTAYSNGAHTVSATATDTMEQTASDSVQTTVSNAQTLRIAQVDVQAIPLLSYGRWWIASAMVTVTEGGSPVVGATIEGVWSGLYNKTASNTTDIFGFISFETGWLRKAGSVTFTITRIVSPDGQDYVLDPAEPSGSTQGP